MSASFKTEGTFTPDTLIVGNAHLLVSRQITLASGQNLSRGAVLGKVTASGKYVLSTSGASDGSQTPDLVLAEACDASGGDKSTVAYSRGDFAAGALTLGASHTASSIAEGLRAKGIVIINTVPA